MKTLKKLFIVDDDTDIVYGLKAILELEGYEVKTSDNAEDALALVSTASLPDLIILDILLSGYDGRDIARILKHHPTTKNIPILLISALPKAHETFKKCGANGFVSKPFDVSILLSYIDAQLSMN